MHFRKSSSLTFKSPELRMDSKAGLDVPRHTSSYLYDLLRPSKRFRRHSEPTAPPSLGLLPQQYLYSPLPNERHIRLLKCLDYDPEHRVIVATLITTNLDDQPMFTALSYTWGSPFCSPNGKPVESPGDAVPSCRLIILDSAQMVHLPPDLKLNSTGWVGRSIGEIDLEKNLSDFLICLNDVRLRWENLPPQDTLLWIDAICIDQSDPEEKCSQIPLMGDIYSNAQEVLGWLGLETPDAHNLIWMIKNVIPALAQHILATSESDRVNLLSGIETLVKHAPYKNECWHDHLQFPLPPDQDCQRMWTSYYTFFGTRSWFRRAWILQEVLLASRMSLLLPGWSASRESILFLEEVLQITGWKNELTSLKGIPSSLHWKDVFLLRTLIIISQDRPLWASQGDLTVDVDIVTRADAPGKPVRSIFGNIRFSSALLTPGGMIGYLLVEGRIYNATFDVDKINAILGVANKILVSLGDSKLHLATTPNDTVERVYINISRLVIEKSTHLSLLRHVENQGLRKSHALPSWVPDFSVQMYKNNTSDFDVWHDDPPEPGRMPHFAEDRMIPFASEIGIVQEVFNAPYVSIESAHSHLGPLLLTVASMMSPVYQPTKESRLEAILRMMLDSPKHAEAGQWSRRQFSTHFPSFLSLLAYMGQYMPLQWGNSGEDKTATMEQLLVVLPDWTRHSISGGEMSLLREMLYIRDQCLFLTDTGYIGKAMQGVQKSDSVMIFERATVPFVVRKLPTGSQSALNRFTRFLSSLWPRVWHAYISCGLTRFLWNVLPNKWRLTGLEKYTFVGDSYVHGVMWGELVAPSFRQTFAPICLV